MMLPTSRPLRLGERPLGRGPALVREGCTRRGRALVVSRDSAANQSQCANITLPDYLESPVSADGGQTASMSYPSYEDDFQYLAAASEVSLHHEALRLEMLLARVQACASLADKVSAAQRRPGGGGHQWGRIAAYKLHLQACQQCSHSQHAASL